MNEPEIQNEADAEQSALNVLLCHTPGPWSVAPSKYINRLAINPAIGEVYGAGSELAANSALIAAAPGMLAALEKLAKLGNEPCYGNSIGNQIARDAIAATVGHNAEFSERRSRRVERRVRHNDQ